MSETTTLTNDMLKAILSDAMVNRGICSDIDSIYQNGIYQSPGAEGVGTFPTEENKWKYGGMIVASMRGHRVLQILSSDVGDIAVRMSFSDHAGWHKWRIVAFS